MAHSCPKKSHTATIRDGQMALFNRLVKYEGTAKVIDVGHESYESFFRIGFVGAAAFLKGEIGIPRELHVELQLVTANLSRFTVINPVSLLNTVAGNRDRLDAFLWPDLLREFALTEKEARHVDTLFTIVIGMEFCVALGAMAVESNEENVHP